MLEIIWRFNIRVFNDEAELAEVLENILALPGMSPKRYDLNRRGQWRAFELNHAVVDALTQRTQLLSVLGDGGAQLMIAMGKHGEQPTAVIQLPEAPGAMETLLDGFSERYASLALHSTLISSASWREALTLAGLKTSVAQGSLGRVMSWRRGETPASLDDLERAQLQGTPVRFERFKDFSRLILSAEDMDAKRLIQDSVHAQLIERIAELF